MVNDPKRVQAVFLDALEIRPEERFLFLDRECVGNSQLRQRVVALLRAHDDSGSFLDRPVAVLDPDALPETLPKEGDWPPCADSLIDTAIGPYKLLQPLGEGGMGRVYVAEQAQPVKRRVALKVIKSGMDSTRVIARFEAERQALALMDHPNIARVFDGGTTETGRPYFVMELVQGVAITRFCDEARLSIRERLKLFIPVCQAVQHAHQKGIIHRDVKPSNVLVSMHDGNPVPKVIDFGIAKAVGEKLTDASMSTEIGQVIGTLEYMSPEQAETSPQGIDTRADVYALGVLLYELLTGQTPLDRKLRGASFAEMLRLIREEEPAKPSTRLTQSRELLPVVAAQRRTLPAHLTREVRGDLDWIVMKTLEKDRNRRYESASAFAADVGRYLDDEPVLACPPSSWYRFRKFARRNKAGLTMAALTLCFLVLLGVLVGWMVRDGSARHAETAARIDSALQDTARLRDQKNWSEARAAAQRADVLLAGGERHPDLRQRLLDLVKDLDMVDRLERVREGQHMEQDDFWDHGRADAAYEAAFREYGIDVLSLDASVAAERVRASAIFEQLLPALDDWAWVSRGKASPRELVRAVVCLADPDPWRVRFRDPAVQRNRLALEELAGRPEVATQPPGTLASFGRALGEAGAHEKAVEVLTAAQRRHPEHFWLNLHMGSFLRWRIQPPRYLESAGYIRAALALRPKAPRVHLELGGSFLAPAHADEAIAALHRALEIQPDYAHPHASIGQALAIKGEWPAAIESYQKCLRGKVGPRLAARVNYDLGTAYRTTNAWDKAIACWQKTVEINPKYVRAHTALAWCLATATDPKLRDPKAAVVHARKAVDLAPKDANHWSNLGVALLRNGDAKAAVKALEKADRMWNGDHQHCFFLAMAYWQMDEKDKARQTYEKGAEWMDKFQSKDEEYRRFRAEAAALLKIEEGTNAK